MQLPMRKSLRTGILAFLWFVMTPIVARAQSVIAGVVKDTSEAVLPGVTVEASSPALIERVRSVVTDAAGQYRIVDLRPGAYVVRFTLPGLTTFSREGTQLTANFTATINAQMSVGQVEQSITVSGQSPVADVQSATQQQVRTQALLDAVPTSSYVGAIGGT